MCPVFEAIRLTPGAYLVESRHESHAAFSATLFHRASGHVPAVVVTAGPGITNAVTGIASASLERVPMLVIAGDVAWATTGGRMADSPPVDFAAWARALGVPAAVVARPGEASAGLIEELMAHGGPALIDARIDASQRIRGGGRVEALQYMSSLLQPTAAIG